MLNFLKKLFGKNKKVEPMKQEPLKEQPVVTPRPEGLDKSTHAAAINDAKADVSKEENIVSTNEEEVTVEDFDSPLVEEEKKEKPAPKAEKEEVKEEKNENDEPVYDIKTHSKGWQVILPGAQRATRVLDTQKEAIEYCKENNYKYKVYKVDGTLQK